MSLLGVQIKMKICWDNLEKFIYDPINHCWKNIYGVKYIYVDGCVVCKEPYLMRTTSPTEFCAGSCSKQGENHHLYNKSLSEEHRRRISKSNKGRKVSKETRDKISKAHKGKGYNRRGECAKNYKGGVTKLNLPLYGTYHKRLSLVDSVRRSKTNGLLLEVKCKKCNEWFTPSRTSVCDRLNTLKFSNRSGESNFYCSDGCKYSCEIFGQILYPKNFDKNTMYTNNEISIWRLEVLKRSDFKCEYCGKAATDAHHIKPKKLEPFFALDPDYGIACCEKCHYKYGHKDECSTGNLAKEVCI